MTEREMRTIEWKSRLKVQHAILPHAPQRAHQQTKTIALRLVKARARRRHAPAIQPSERPAPPPHYCHRYLKRAAKRIQIGPVNTITPICLGKARRRTGEGVRKGQAKRGVRWTRARGAPRPAAQDCTSEECRGKKDFGKTLTYNYLGGGVAF